MKPPFTWPEILFLLFFFVYSQFCEITKDKRWKLVERKLQDANEPQKIGE